jgi:hypothetical protein
MNIPSKSNVLGLLAGGLTALGLAGCDGNNHIKYKYVHDWRHNPNLNNPEETQDPTSLSSGFRNVHLTPDAAQSPIANIGIIQSGVSTVVHVLFNGNGPDGTPNTSDDRVWQEVELTRPNVAAVYSEKGIAPIVDREKLDIEVRVNGRTELPAEGVNFNGEMVVRKLANFDLVDSVIVGGISQPQVSILTNTRTQESEAVINLKEELVPANLNYQITVLNANGERVLENRSSRERNVKIPIFATEDKAYSAHIVGNGHLVIYIEHNANGQPEIKMVETATDVKIYENSLGMGNRPEPGPDPGPGPDPDPNRIVAPGFAATVPTGIPGTINAANFQSTPTLNRIPNRSIFVFGQDAQGNNLEYEVGVRDPGTELPQGVRATETDNGDGSATLAFNFDGTQPAHSITLHVPSN